MKLWLIPYFFRRAILNLKGSILINILTVVTITVAMLLLAAFLLVSHNLNSILAKEETKLEISVYLKDGTGEARISELGRIIKSREGVSEVRFLSKDNALKAFLSWNNKLGPVVRKIPENPFPASFEVRFAGGFNDPEKIKAAVMTFSGLDDVESVDYSSELYEKLASFLKALKGTGVLALVFIAFATILLVSNTIRLNVYARRDEIGIMRIVGATDIFIKIPFLIEGFLQGVLGSGLAVIFLYAVFRIVRIHVETTLGYIIGSASLNFIPWEQVWYILALGVIVGFFGSNFAVRRFLKGEL